MMKCIHKSACSVCFLLLTLMLVGCGRSARETELSGSDNLMGGDVFDTPLTERFEEGARVPKSEFQVRSVGFAYDSFQVAAAELWKVEKVAGFLRKNRNVRLVVEGHCDERGSREYNMSLGEHRALAVRAHLTRLGIAGRRVQTRSYGEESLVNRGHNNGAHKENRRGEFVLFR